MFKRKKKEHTKEEIEKERLKRKQARDNRTPEQIARKQKINRQSYERRKNDGRLKKYVLRKDLPAEVAAHEREIDKNHRLKNLDKTRAKAKKYARTPKGRHKFMRNTARKRNLEVTISLNEYIVLIEMPCYYCSGEMNTPSVAGIGLDRIDNSKGYHIDNVLPCCTACNVIKSDYLTVEETKIAIDAVLKFRKKDIN